MYRRQFGVALPLLLVVCPLIVLSHAKFNNDAETKRLHTLSAKTHHRPTVDRNSGTYAIPWDVLDGGGGGTVSANYRMKGSLSQTAVGTSRSSSYQVYAGYWHGEFPTHTFIRGDVNGSGGLSIGDGLRCFRCQFVPGWQDSCRCDDALDADDGGSISIGDCLRILRKQFVPGWQDSIPPPCCSAPADCGPDPTADGLGCDEHIPCGNPPGKAAPPEQKVIGGKLAAEKTTIEDGKVILPVYLSNNRELSGFAYTISYDPSVLHFVSLETEGLVTEKFDFVSALPEDGEVKVGAVVSFDFSQSLPKGNHHVANLVFEAKQLDYDVLLKFMDAELVDVNCKSLTATLSDAVIRGLMVPKVFALRQAFPNPFAGATTIRYQLPKESHVALKIYNSAGQLVNTLVNKPQPPGYYRAEWDGKDEAGMKVASGIYFYRIEVDKFRCTKKIIFLH